MPNLFLKRRWWFAIVGGLIVLIVSLSSCAQNGISTTPTDTPTPNQELSTPELIDQALARGEITEEERLLYLAYALYEPESLPARYRSEVGWFGDVAVGELIDAVDSPATLCSMSPNVRNELLRLVKKTDDGTACK